MKILIIGGTHGNEPLGPMLVRSLAKKPIPNVTTLIGNPKAVAGDCRFIQQDLNRSFPGNSASATYEQRRAVQVMAACQGYDVVLDFHNTEAPNNDCTFIGEQANPLLLQVASFFNLKKVIIADYDCINKYVPSCISLELSVKGARMSVARWRTAISRLAALPAPALPPATNLQLYRYATTITNQQRDDLGLTDQQLPVFEPMPTTIAAALGATAPAYPIFIGSTYTPGIFGGVLNRLNDIPAMPEDLQ